MGHEEDNKAKGNPDACIVKKPMNIFTELNHLFCASPIQKKKHTQYRPGQVF